MTIAELDLEEPAESFARAVQAAHPKVVWTSGRRTKTAQAHAMAENVAVNRKWIVDTYKDSYAAEVCQAWVDAHPEVTDLAGIEAGLIGVLELLTDDEYVKLTRHGLGLAVDAAPWSCPAELFKSLATKYGGDVLTEEGGEPKLHAQFKQGGLACF